MKVIINKLQGSNILAYGDFSLDMDSEVVHQLVGKNGSGKSSLPVILEEILFNSNSRGIKKAKLVNRKTGTTGWWGQVDFTIGDDKYVVKKTVKSSAKVEFSKNGTSLEGHTATQTYAAIKTVLGDLDFKTFSKLVYQSMESSLDFLKATDTGRKKFLTSFLGLEKYALIEVELKAQDKALKETLVSEEKALTRLESMISKSSSLERVPVQDQVVVIPDYTQAITKLEQDRADVLKHNLEVDVHNEAITKAKKELKRYSDAEANLATLLSERPAQGFEEVDPSQLSTCGNELVTTKAAMAVAKRNYQKYKAEAENTHCDVCKQSIDTTTQANLTEQYKAEFLSLRTDRERLQSEYDNLLAQDTAYKEQVAWENKYETDSTFLGSLDKPSAVSVEERKYKSDSSFVAKIAALKLEVEEAKALQAEMDIAKAKAIANNEAYDKIQNSLREQEQEATELREGIAILNAKRAKLAVLLKAFSPKGIIGYKIESSVKIFEEQINKYLSVFAKGQFALTFRLDGAKLLVVIYDEGEETDMASLSSGEAAKVNISTLLAIRNLMSAVSKVNMNVLFLDEVISVLDQESSDTLVEILLEEHDLNTFIVSHNYVHPLTKVKRIVKQGTESKIIDG